MDKRDYLELQAVDREPLPPDEERAADIFSRLGYRFADAIADLVDNSVDAGAANVHIRFVRSSAGIHSVLIADDGSGMNESELREAMRFGSRSAKSGTQLGKYGIGLKSASLSQADTVTVITRQAREKLGRRWTLENVRKNWTCEILRVDGVSRVLDQEFGAFKIKRSGTIVMWERLEHLQALPNNLDQVLVKTTGELCTELGIRFHRFLESGQLQIGIDQQFWPEEPSGVARYVEGLNPFSYEESGRSGYPVTLPFKLGATKVAVECHVWPPKSNRSGYRLGGGKVALRQGFYFYRNNRIIQAGGWNGIKADDGEPHLSLARVRVDLPSALDSMFKLDVAKSRLDPSPNFISALHEAKSASGLTFEKYLSDAELTYRKQKTKEAARFPCVPGLGISPKAQSAIATILSEKGTSRPKKVSFRWTKLDADEIVRIDAENDVILLNARYKKNLKEGTGNDAPVLKVALMFLFQGELEKSFATKKAMEWLQKINQALLASMKE